MDATVAGRPYILHLGTAGIVSDMTQTGFDPIGTGSEKSISKMLYSEHKRSREAYRTLYDIFDAKAFAEMSSGVGLIGKLG
jgi:hypothetical protein